MALDLKYRPRCWADLVGQETIVSILSRQIATKSWKNVYLFTGPHGCGKTSAARVLASEINNGEGSPIEMDCASNNGVDTIRELISDAQQSSIDSEYKTYILDECVTGDTEILTNKGWKRFDELDRTEKVAQYNVDGSIEFVKPNDYITMDYSGPMYKVSVGNKANFIMSPNHVQPLLYCKSNLVKEKYIKDVKFHQGNKFVRSGFGKGELESLSVEDKLAICLQADGTLEYCGATYNYWTIHLKKDRKKDRLLSLLSEFKGEYKEIKTNRKGYIRYAIKTPSDITKILSTHFDISVMSGDYAKEFIKELMLWDGYVAYGVYHYYSSIVKENVDFCQSVAVLGGFSSRQSVQVDNRSEKFSDVYRLYLTESFTNPCNAYVKKEEISFDGKIYCVKVPSHMIIIRRDGYEIVTGNCHNLTRAAWDASLKLIEEPPLNSVFIFCTTNPEKIPGTILSRVQRFDFRRVPKNLIADRIEYILQSELHNSYDRVALERIASLADGHMRDAIKYLDKCLDASANVTTDVVEATLGLAKYDTLIKIMRSIFNNDITSGFKALEELKSYNTDLLGTFNSLVLLALDSAIYAQTKDVTYTSIPKDYVEFLSKDINLTKAVAERFVYFSKFVNADNAETLIKTVFVEFCG